MIRAVIFRHTRMTAARSHRPEGVFQDDYGDFPAGSYVRNPPTSRHIPGSEPGCIIFVKLWQFDAEDLTHVRIEMSEATAVADPERPGVGVVLLFKNAREEVRLQRWGPGIEANFKAKGGAELLILRANRGGDPLRRYSWVRISDGKTVSPGETARTSGSRPATFNISDLPALERLKRAAFERRLRRAWSISPALASADARSHNAAARNLSVWARGRTVAPLTFAFPPEPPGCAACCTISRDRLIRRIRSRRRRRSA
jgi:hypothetical protein